MLKAGRTQTLTVNRISDYGLYLIDDEQNEVLLPQPLCFSGQQGRRYARSIRLSRFGRPIGRHDRNAEAARRRSGIPARSGQEPARRIPRLGTRGQDLFLPNRNQQGGVLGPDGTAWFTCM